MSYTICYSSKKAKDLSEEEIQKIFQTTSRSNNENGIKGILLYALENFFQVLEGPKEVIVPLYEDKIRKDPRHQQVFEIIHRETPISIFSNYNSDFNIVKTTDQLDHLKNYFKQHRLQSNTSEKVSRLLNPFIL